MAAPKEDHPWRTLPKRKREATDYTRSMGDMFRKQPRTISDELQALELQRAIEAGKVRRIPIGVSGVPYSGVDSTVIPGEGCSMKRPVRYG